MLKQKQNKKHEHEHQSKKERRDAITVFYQITSSIKQSTREGQKVQRIAISEVRGLYIYIYSLQAKSTSNFNKR